jgi:iron complex outermembrane receptor protein
MALPVVITGFWSHDREIMGELFYNFENFTDTRQTRFGSIYTGSLSNPVFKDILHHLTVS